MSFFSRIIANQEKEYQCPCSKKITLIRGGSQAEFIQLKSKGWSCVYDTSSGLRKIVLCTECTPKMKNIVTKVKALTGIEDIGDLSFEGFEKDRG